MRCGVPQSISSSGFGTVRRNEAVPLIVRTNGTIVSHSSLGCAAGAQRATAREHEAAHDRRSTARPIACAAVPARGALCLRPSAWPARHGNVRFSQAAIRFWLKAARRLPRRNRSYALDYDVQLCILDCSRCRWCCCSSCLRMTSIASTTRTLSNVPPCSIGILRCAALRCAARSLQFCSRCNCTVLTVPLWRRTSVTAADDRNQPSRNGPLLCDAIGRHRADKRRRTH